MVTFTLTDKNHCRIYCDHNAWQIYLPQRACWWIMQWKTSHNPRFYTPCTIVQLVLSRYRTCPYYLLSHISVAYTEECTLRRYKYHHLSLYSLTCCVQMLIFLLCQNHYLCSSEMIFRYLHLLATVLAEGYMSWSSDFSNYVILLGLLTLEDWADRLFRNVGD